MLENSSIPFMHFAIAFGISQNAEFSHLLFFIICTITNCMWQWIDNVIVLTYLRTHCQSLYVKIFPSHFDISSNCELLIKFEASFRATFACSSIDLSFPGIVFVIVELAALFSNCISPISDILSTSL